MRLIAIGRPDEVRGFALAGVETWPCHTALDADRLLQTIGSDTAVGLIMIPGWVGHAANATIARVRATRRGPVILVLPNDTSELT
jgi:vacuolar-type H+-ATPase subunit F/Vma7